MGYKEKVCVVCEKRFKPKSHNNIYCSKACCRKNESDVRKKKTLIRKWGTENPIIKCRNCGVEFTPANPWNTTYCSKDCHTYYDNNINEHQQASRRAYKYKKEFGITIEDYDRMHDEQDGKCKICGTAKEDIERKYFSVDHCHTTGKVRGLLCHKCNSGLGAFGDDITKLKQAVAYLDCTKEN